MNSSAPRDHAAAGFGRVHLDVVGEHPRIAAQSLVSMVRQ